MINAMMNDAALSEKAWERIPLRRASQSEEIAAAVAFLASDEALWITGPRWRWTAAKPAPMADLSGVNDRATA
jgi:NAD(P)-dependent dehydrogenase (short-subunit alcohol dehydrogenase family)